LPSGNIGASCFQHLLNENSKLHRSGTKWFQINVPAENRFYKSLNREYAIEPELFDFQSFRFSFVETTEEATGKRISKFINRFVFLMHSLV
jgi:hypothetical protein